MEDCKWCRHIKESHLFSASFAGWWCSDCDDTDTSHPENWFCSFDEAGFEWEG